MAKPAGYLLFKTARFAVFSIFGVASLGWLSLFTFLFVMTWGDLGRTHQATFLVILLTYGLSLFPFYFMPVFHFPLWVEGTLVVLVLLCQVGGTIALSLEFDPDKKCHKSQACRTVSDIVLFGGCGLTALLVLYLFLLLAVSRIHPAPRPRSTHHDLEYADEPLFGCNGKDPSPSHALRPISAFVELPSDQTPPKPSLNEYFKRSDGYALPRTGTADSSESYVSDNRETPIAEPVRLKSPQRDHFTWSRRRSLRPPDRPDISDARSIASTTRQIIEYYRAQSGFGASGTRGPRSPAQDALQFPRVPPVPPPPPLAFPRTRQKTAFSKRTTSISRNRHLKPSRLKPSALFAVSSVYSQESMDPRQNLPRSPSPVVTSRHEGVPEPRELATTAAAANYPPSPQDSNASPTGSVRSRIPPSRKKSILERARSRFDKSSGSGSQNGTAWI